MSSSAGTRREERLFIYSHRFPPVAMVCHLLYRLEKFCCNTVYNVAVIWQLKSGWRRTNCFWIGLTYG